MDELDNISTVKVIQYNPQQVNKKKRNKKREEPPKEKKDRVVTKTKRWTRMSRCLNRHSFCTVKSVKN